LKNNGSLFIAVSEFVKKKLLEKGFPEDKVITHYLGVDVNVKPAIPNDEKIILFAGRLVEVKGVEYLILAAADVCKYHPDAKILICGDGPRRKDLEYLAKTKGLTKNVIFPGWKTREELAALMRRARVFVLPSITTRDGRVEGLGMVLLEAMACGLPVIGTNQGGIPEAVLDGENGFIVPEKHSVGLSEKIRLLLDDRALSTRMGNKGRELANDKFDIRKQVAGLEKIYRSMGI
jgi:glycosyltransferase involved in cell wall biosynthesis